jgi:hypothetical protein
VRDMVADMSLSGLNMKKKTISISSFLQLFINFFKIISDQPSLTSEGPVIQFPESRKGAIFLHTVLSASGLEPVHVVTGH